MISIDAYSNNSFHSPEPDNYGRDFSDQSPAYTMHPDSTYFREIPRTQPPINPSLHLSPYPHPPYKEILSASSTAPFPSPPEQDVTRRSSTQSRSSVLLSPSRRSAFTPFQSPNTQDIRNIHQTRYYQSSIHINGLLTPTSHTLPHHAPLADLKEENNIPRSYEMERPLPHRTFQPKILCSQFPTPTSSLPRQEVKYTKEPKVTSETFPPRCSIYPQQTYSPDTSSNEAKSASNHVYDPIRDSWTSNSLQQHSSEETQLPIVATTLTTFSKEKLPEEKEEVSHTSPQLTISPQLQEEILPNKQPKRMSPGLGEFSGLNSIAPALPSSPPLSPVAATKNRRRTLSPDFNLHETTFKAKRKLNSEETKEDSKQSPTNSCQGHTGLSNLSKLCHDNSAGTELADLDSIQDYYKQCEPPLPSETPHDTKNGKASSTSDEKVPKSLGQISSMMEEKSLQDPVANLASHEFEEESMLDVEETIDSIESFLTQDVDIFGSISEEDPTTSNWSIISNRRKPISSLLLSDTSDHE